MRTFEEREFRDLPWRDQLAVVREAAVAVQRSLVVEVSRGPMLEKVGERLGLSPYFDPLIKALDGVRKSGYHTLPGDKTATSGQRWNMWQPFRPDQVSLDPGQVRANGEYDPATGEVLGPVYGPPCTPWSRNNYQKLDRLRRENVELRYQMDRLAAEFDRLRQSVYLRQPDA